jgi:hypothetical protein
MYILDIPSKIYTVSTWFPPIQGGAHLLSKWAPVFLLALILLSNLWPLILTDQTGVKSNNRIHPSSIYSQLESSKKNVSVTIAPAAPACSLKPSLILVKSYSPPLVSIDLTLLIKIKNLFGFIEKTIEATYEINGTPLPWEPGTYFVPVPGLPVFESSTVNVTSWVSFDVYVDNEIAFRGGYNVTKCNFKENKPPLVYAFVEDLLGDPQLASETLGLSPPGWSISSDKDVNIYVIIIDDYGISNVTFEYKVDDGRWIKAGLERATLFAPIEKTVDLLKKSISSIIPYPSLAESLMPIFPVKLYIVNIPEQPEGSFVEFRALAEDVNGSIAESLHGFYYVDKGDDASLKVLIVDPWVSLWTLSRVLHERKPVVAVDLFHGENSRNLDTLINIIDFVDWVILNESITLQTLRNVDVLIIGQPQSDLAEDEIKAIETWLAEGGKVLWVAADSDYRDGNFNGPKSQAICNRVLEAVGSRLRVDLGGVYDDVNNIGGKSYRVLARVRPDFIHGLATQIIQAGISRPVLFHGPAPIIWVDESGAPHDPVNETFEGLVRIVWSYKTSKIRDNNPPAPILYNPSSDVNRTFVLMAAEVTSSGSIIIVSGETPYGGFAPISLNDYLGVELDGLRFLENTLTWALLATKIKSNTVFAGLASAYGLPSSLEKLMETISLTADMLGFTKFHHWEVIANFSDIYVVYPSPRVEELLNTGSGKFAPNVIILSNLLLGVNISPILDWDLRDIPTLQGSTLLDAIIDYVKETHAGVIATHGTLSDLVVWASCNTKLKVGSRGHVGFNLSDVNVFNERTVAGLLGVPHLALWEMVRDHVAEALCLSGMETSGAVVGLALYVAGIMLGSTPLQIPYVPWDGKLKVTEAARILGWSIDNEVEVYIPNMYEKLGYKAYTQVGWQLALPVQLARSILPALPNFTSQISLVYDYLSALEPVQNLSAELGRLMNLKAPNITYEALLNAHIKNGIIQISLDPSFLNSTLKDVKPITVNINVGSLPQSLSWLIPVKIVAVSPHREASVIAYDKYWDPDGFRSVYFSFEVEASSKEASLNILVEAVKWVAKWEYKPIATLINGFLPVTQDIASTYTKLTESITGYRVYYNTTILTASGESFVKLAVDENKIYHIIIVHPSLESINIRVHNAQIVKSISKSNITYVQVKSLSTEITLIISGSPKNPLSVVYIEVFKEKEVPPSVTETTTTTTPTITTKSETTTTTMATTTKEITETTISTPTKTETHTTKTSPTTKSTTKTPEYPPTATTTEVTTHTSTSNIINVVLENKIIIVIIVVVIILLILFTLRKS